jgi:hypothetical protein
VMTAARPAVGDRPRSLVVRTFSIYGIDTFLPC